MVLSRLTRSILPVIAVAKGSPLSRDEVARIEAIMHDHGLDGEVASDFLLAWFGVLGDGQVYPELFFVPPGYPEGASGLVNILSDIGEQVLCLDIEDTGEQFRWRLPTAGLVACIIRETTLRDGYLGTIRPLNEEPHAWLLAAYQRLRQRGEREALRYDT